VADRNNNTNKLVVSPSNFQIGLKEHSSDLTVMGKASVRKDLIVSGKASIEGELCLSVGTYRLGSTIDKNVCVAFVYGGGSIFLPSGISLGHYLCIKDADGSAAVSNIIVSDPRGGLIDGSSTLSITTNYGSRMLCWNNAWFVVSST
jgi:hypothetical protein